MEIPWWSTAAKVTRLRWLNISLALMFFGCSTTTVIKPGQNLFLEQSGVLITKAGKNIDFQRTQVHDDSILVVDSRLGQKVKMPVIEAQKLVLKKRGQGAWQGMLLFAGVGAVLGAIPDQSCEDTCLFPNGGLGGSLFLAALAAPAGAFWGAIVGSHREYLFEQPAPVSDPVSNYD